MADTVKRYAVVTGANKGVGFGTVKQLASKGVVVVLTARDEKRGLEALEKLKDFGISDLVVFHQLDVTDSASAAVLADFVKTQFGKLDILRPEEINWSEIPTIPNDEVAEQCLKTNYYGTKSVTEALLPLLQLSDSPRIVNVSSGVGKLMNFPNGWAKEVLSDAERLTEEKIDSVLIRFLEDLKKGDTKIWSPIFPPYTVSKAALNAYTRILAKKYPNFCINCVSPGFVKTDITFNVGILTIDEGAESLVRLALLPNGGPTGLYFDQKEVASYAVVTGANKGVGFGTVKQLASKGVVVVLTARDEKRGLEALEKLKDFGISDLVVFHQLDVTDSASAAVLADFVKTQFGKLDILVNNAAINGSMVNPEAFISAATAKKPEEINWNEIPTIPNYELAEECLKTNYYGTKRVTEALLPLLQLSDSPRIVNVSTGAAKLMNFPNGWPKEVLSDAETLTEERIDSVLSGFLEDSKRGLQDIKIWPPVFPPYTVSKAALNAYTRILAKKYPNFCINCGSPGFVKTDMSFNAGILTIDEGAESIVRLALLPNGGSTGLYFSRKEICQTDITFNVGILTIDEGAESLVRLAGGPTGLYFVVTGANKGVGFGTVKQLASKGVVVVLTARNEKRGLEALAKVKDFGISDLVVFHQLDVTDSASAAVLADFVKTQFGKLDILVCKSQTLEPIFTEECLKTNYYGTKRVTEALLPLLQLSDSPRIINVSTGAAKLMVWHSPNRIKFRLVVDMNFPNGWPKEVLSDAETLTEERIDSVLNGFLEDSKQGLQDTKIWPPVFPPYTVSKAALNAYTRILAKKYPNFCINCGSPGFVKTDMSFDAGILTIDEGAESIVRYAVVTGANKGVGFGIVKQLASNGVIVVLTARDEKRGLEAVEKLKDFGLSELVVFHQLDVTDSASIASLAGFVKTQFAKLDILKPEEIDFSEISTTPNYELAEECLKTNYYGAKSVTEALLPLLQLSDSPRIVNVSSLLAKLTNFPNGRAKEVLSDAEIITEERIEAVLSEFLDDYKHDLLETKGWSHIFPAYKVSKAALNAYTRILAKKYPNFCINCGSPGLVKTDMSFNLGVLTIDEGAESIVRLALLPNGGPTGLYFVRKEMTPF
ncbi:unnamed protein product [Malus baccata var. baccata]